MNKSRIQWTDYTWSPVTGCSKVSQGCKNCYAEAWHKRFRGGDFSVKLHPDKLHEPLHGLKGFERKHGRRPRVFVGPMTDLFHADVPDDFLYQVFITMALSSHIDFQIVTKRPDRMRAWASYDDGETQSTASIILGRALDRIHRDPSYSDAEWVRTYLRYPLPNVWLGVTAENQEEADRRIPILLKTPAAIRWVSVEPMLGGIEFGQINIGEYFCPVCDEFYDMPGSYLSPCCNAPESDETTGNGYELNCPECGNTFNTDEEILECPECGNIGGQYMPFAPSDVVRADDKTTAVLRKIDWVIVGGESGAHARPMQPDWVKSIRDQCNEADVPFFFKQWGPEGGYVDESGMPLLDGKVHDAFPEVMR